jgi:type III pantothenate kinase
MLLVIDIGNTNITLGLFEFDTAGHPRRGPSQTWRLSTNRAKTADEYGIEILALFHVAGRDTGVLRGVAIASVVPPLDHVFAELTEIYFHHRAFFVGPRTRALGGMLYDNPAEVGADRVADAAAAFAFFGGPAIVIDFGTATTFDCINVRGQYLGGIIAPGPLISAESLAERTAKLPRVEVAKPERAIAQSTVTSIQAGLYYGYVGLIKEILTRITAELPGKPKIIATGGLANLIVPEIREVRHVVPELTLEGIRIIWEAAQKTGGSRNKKTGI